MKTSEYIRLILTVVICGAGTLALEILASRYMVPSFGTSIFIWGAVLSVTLFYLAVGYRWGGKVASRVQASIGNGWRLTSCSQVPGSPLPL